MIDCYAKQLFEDKINTCTGTIKRYSTPLYDFHFCSCPMSPGFITIHFVCEEVVTEGFMMIKEGDTTEELIEKFLTKEKEQAASLMNWANKMIAEDIEE